jgi:RNA polymerase sigma-70 factor (ECF subfamily)
MSVAAAHVTPSPLLPLVAAGDEGAMHQLVRRFTPFVRRVAQRTGANHGTTDDIVQETMVRLWRSAHRFDPARGSEPTFIAAVARNTTIDLARREACRPAEASADPQVLGSAAPSDTERVATVLTVRAALRELSPMQRELLRLAYFEQLTQDEIARHLGVPLGTVKSRTFHAFRYLRTILGDEAPALAGAAA